VVDQASTYLWRQGWVNVEMLGLECENATPLNIYVDCLYKSHVRLKDEEDSLIWSKNQALVDNILYKYYILFLG